MDASFTAVELVAEAGAEGRNLSARLIKDWVRKGLLDRAGERGRGRGRGFDRSWPSAQCDLLLDLLGRRIEGASVRELANVPVARWLLGEPIPTRQVRRALATWAMPSGTPSIRAARTVARDITRWMRLSPARTDAFDELLALLAKAIYEDSAAGPGFERTRLSREPILKLLRRVIPEAAAYSPAGHVLIGATPEFNAHLLQTEVNALGCIARARSLDVRGHAHDKYLDWIDAALEQARLVAYLNIAATPARSPDVSIDLDQRAIVRLLPTLGMELHHPADPR